MSHKVQQVEFSDVAGTSLPKKSCCRIFQLSGHTMGQVAATYPWNMSLLHFRKCVPNVILSLLRSPVTCPCYVSPALCLDNAWFFAAHVPASWSLVCGDLNGSASASWYVCSLSPAKQQHETTKFCLFERKKQRIGFLVCMFCISIWSAPITHFKTSRRL